MWTDLLTYLWRKFCGDINRKKSYESYRIRKDGTYNSPKQEITEYILTDTNV